MDATMRPTIVHNLEASSCRARLSELNRASDDGAIEDGGSARRYFRAAATLRTDPKILYHICLQFCQMVVTILKHTRLDAPFVEVELGGSGEKLALFAVGGEADYHSFPTTEGVERPLREALQVSFVVEKQVYGLFSPVTIHCEVKVILFAVICHYPVEQPQRDTRALLEQRHKLRKMSWVVEELIQSIHEQVLFTLDAAAGADTRVSYGYLALLLLYHDTMTVLGYHDLTQVDATRSERAFPHLDSTTRSLLTPVRAISSHPPTISLLQPIG